MDYSPAFSSIYQAVEVARITFFVAVGLSAMMCGLFAYTVAESKHRNGWSWFLAGFLCNFVAVIAIAGMPSLPPAPVKKRPEYGPPIEGLSIL